MIVELIEEVSKYLPLIIKKINWDSASLNISGDNWSFGTLSAWRMVYQNKLISSGDELNAYQGLQKLIGFKLYLIELQTSHLATDPVFYFTDDSHETTIKFEIFSTLRKQPWSFQSLDQMIYIPSKDH